MRPAIFLSAILLSACAAKHERDMRSSEKTFVSDEVRAIVENSKEPVDVRKLDNVRCERIRIVGTHMVHRLCYTSEEEKAQVEATQKRYYARFGAQKCLDTNLADPRCKSD